MWLAAILENVKTKVRGPLLCALYTQYVFLPVYTTVVTWMRESLELSDVAIFSLLFSVIHFLLYWGVNGFFWFIDQYGYLKKYKVSRAKHQIPTPERLRATLKEGLIAQFVTGPIILAGLWYVMVSFGTPEVLAPLEGGLGRLYFQFLICELCNEGGFYWAHRLFHHPSLYRFHKQHHTYNGTIGFAAEYAHPLEQVFANYIPTIVGGVAMGMHCAAFVCWMQWRLVETYEVHSGYSFKHSWLDRVGLLHADMALYHDFHHSKNVGNYGQGEYGWDFLCGTSHLYEDYKQQQVTMTQSNSTKKKA